MLCTTTREGMECAFMTEKGCSYNGGTCHPAVEACEGCARAVQVGDLFYCTTYPDPASKRRYGICNFATHVKDQSEVKEVKLNPIKASKRAAGRR
jgi:hypothetical protein